MEPTPPQQTGGESLPQAITQLQKVSSTKILSLAKRPKIEYDQKSKPISLVTNYLKIDFNSDIEELFLFKVEFSPLIEIDNKVFRERLLNSIKQQLIQQLGNRFLVRGGYIFSVQKPAFIEQSTTIKFTFQKSSYSVTITFLKSGKIDDLDENHKNCKSILYSLMREMVKSINFNHFMRDQYFDISSEGSNFKIEGTNLQFLKSWKLVLENEDRNENNRMGMMLKLDQKQWLCKDESLLQFINQIYLNYADQSKEEKRQIVKKRLIGQYVVSNYGGFRKIKVTDIIFDKTIKDIKLSDPIIIQEQKKEVQRGEEKIIVEENKVIQGKVIRSNANFNYSELTIYEYYLQRYGMKIQYEKQPIIIGSDQQVKINQYFVPELLLFLGQYEQPSELTVKQIKKAKRQIQEEQYQTILKLLSKLDKESNPSLSTLSSSLNINFSQNTIVLNSKQIQPPTITFGSKKESPKIVVDEQQVTNFSLKNPIFANSQNPLYIALLHFHEFNSDDLLNNWNKILKELKIDVKKIVPFDLGDYNSSGALSDIESVLKNEITGQKKDQSDQKKDIKKDKYDIVVIIAPSGLATSNNYSKIKRMCTLNHSIRSQFIKSSTLENKSSSFTASASILLQIAAKCGATLWEVTPPGGHPNSTMIAGLSVKKSFIKGQEQLVIGFVATEVQSLKFYSRTVILKTNKSMSDNDISDLQDIEKKYLLTDAVKYFFKVMKKIPEQIIYLREEIQGYSDNSFLQKEIQDILHSFPNLSPNYDPKLQVILVSDLHQLRCFSNTSQQQLLPENVSSNPADEQIQQQQFIPSGTVIDQVVTSKDKYDFYLISQNSKNATSIPVRYKVIYDSTSLSEGRTQELIYSQCFNYANWNGVVKYPAPLMYAKKLANFVANYLYDDIPLSLCSSRFYI